MNSRAVYSKLEKDFFFPGLDAEDWPEQMPEFAGKLSDGFKRMGNGLMFDNADEIEQVYTAVFPSDRVLDHIIARGRA